MRDSDVHQAAVIEREAFPTMFPPTSFGREIKKRTTSYLVACRREDVVGGLERGAAPSGVEPGGPGSGLVSTLLGGARNVLGGMGAGRQADGERVVGFLGAWHLADEAHIVSVGVRRDYRSQGVGELLLIGAIDQALANRGSTVTLEVRPSNVAARGLYGKYGFKERGLRKGYYADDREDAIIMSTGPIDAPPYPGLVRRLREQHRRRWGVAELVLT